jgi:hypothetical protein
MDKLAAGDAQTISLFADYRGKQNERGRRGAKLATVVPAQSA